jgi:hypothetical protein
MQGDCRNTFLTTERLCFLLGPCKVVIKKEFSWEKLVVFRDASLPVYELCSSGIELNRVFRIGDGQCM